MERAPICRVVERSRNLKWRRSFRVRTSSIAPRRSRLYHLSISKWSPTRHFHMVARTQPPPSIGVAEPTTALLGMEEHCCVGPTASGTRRWASPPSQTGSWTAFWRTCIVSSFEASPCAGGRTFPAAMCHPEVLEGAAGQHHDDCARRRPLYCPLWL